MPDSLSTCIAKIFAVDELEQWMTDNYPKLVRGVSFSGSREQVAFSVVQKLERHGDLNNDCLRRLKDVRPGKAKALDEAYAGHMAGRRSDGPHSHKAHSVHFPHAVRVPEDVSGRSSGRSGTSAGPGDALDAVRRRHIDGWRNAVDKRHERFIELELMPAADGPTKPQTFTSLSALMNDVHESGVLLVGDPGAGKTTLLRYLQYELSAEDLESGRQRVIFLLELRTYRRRQQLELRDWFEAAFIRACAELGGLKDRLASGDVWLLLDGLNEMPYGANARARFDDLRDVLIDLPAGNRVIVSCRSQDVEGSLGRVRRAEIKPLSEDAVSKFLAKYAPDKAEVALKELRKHKLLELYQNPGDLGAGGAPRR